MKIMKILLYLFIFVNFILIGFLFTSTTGNVVYAIEKANITKVIDGDTFNTELGKVRLSGVNTPEEGEYAYDRAKIFLSGYENQEVELVRLGDDKDQYGRLLRYVFYQGSLINEQILRNGLAHTFYYQEDELTPRLLKAENQARKIQAGIWGKSTDECSKCIVLQELNELDPGEYVILKNICFSTCSLVNWTIKDEATHLKTLDFELTPQTKKKIDYEGRIWNDNGDTLFLRDEKGLLVLFYRY